MGLADPRRTCGAEKRSLSRSVNDGQFAARWVEAGGPLLNGTPQHEGFGSVLARRIVTGQFGGQLLYDWKPEGLVVSLSVPVERLPNYLPINSSYAPSDGVQTDA